MLQLRSLFYDISIVVRLSACSLVRLRSLVQGDAGTSWVRCLGTRDFGPVYACEILVTGTLYRQQQCVHWKG